MTMQQDAYVVCQGQVTEDCLLEVALSKSKVLVESDKWNTPSNQDSKIIALATEMYA